MGAQAVSRLDTGFSARLVVDLSQTTEKVVQFPSVRGWPTPENQGFAADPTAKLTKCVSNRSLSTVGI